MPNDITTLAIEIQSQEAERNLKSFYEMMTVASQTAGKMEKVSISMDAGQAIAHGSKGGYKGSNEKYHTRSREYGGTAAARTLRRAGAPPKKSRSPRSGTRAP